MTGGPGPGATGRVGSCWSPASRSSCVTTWMAASRRLDPDPPGRSSRRRPVSAIRSRRGPGASSAVPPCGTRCSSRTVEVANHHRPGWAAAHRRRDVASDQRRSRDTPAGWCILCTGSAATPSDMFHEGANGYVPAVFPSIAVFPEGEWISWNAGACCRPDHGARDRRRRLPPGVGHRHEEAAGGRSGARLHVRSSPTAG